MSAVSGFATIASASALHGGRPEAASHSKARPAGGPGTGDRAFRMDDSLARAVERVAKAGTATDMPLQAEIVRAAGPHGRFVDAVQALRLTEAEAARLNPARVAELKEAAREVFSVATGIPRAQSPIEVYEEQRLRETELRKEVPIGPPETGSGNADDPFSESSGEPPDAAGTPRDGALPDLPASGDAPKTGTGSHRDGAGHAVAGEPELPGSTDTTDRRDTAPSGPGTATPGNADHSPTS